MFIDKQVKSQFIYDVTHERCIYNDAPAHS